MKSGIFLLLFFFLEVNNTKAQTITSYEVLGSAASPSAMFLLIPPDAVSGAMGWTGVAADTNIYSEFYNPAQTAFLKKDFDLNIAYYPWISAIVNDANYTNISLKIRTGQRSNINFSYVHMSYYEWHFRNVKLKPVESSIGISGSYLISEFSSIGIKLKYIQSNLLINSVDTFNSNLRNFHSIACGVSYYHNHSFTLFKKSSLFNFGASIDNIGSKIGNDTLGLQAFIPAILRVGQSTRINISDVDEITLKFDIYKMLTPSPPVYQRDSSSGRSTGVIIAGEDPDKPVFSSLINSFSDAQGGSDDEIKEIHYCAAIEYGYKNGFFLRSGYFHESSEIGNARFFTVGAAVKFSISYTFDLAFAYLIPVEQRSPLENTLSFSLRVH
jgi:hypothetical protein